jgi:plasmid stabilization system protein ParE
MLSEEKKVIWSKRSQKQLQDAYMFIYEQSPKNAEKVRNDIIAITRRLGQYPEIYTPDKYKIENDGNYRAFEKHHYRVAYRILKGSINILRIRHTSMEPLFY